MAMNAGKTRFDNSATPLPKSAWKHQHAQIQVEEEPGHTLESHAKNDIREQNTVWKATSKYIWDHALPPAQSARLAIKSQSPASLQNRQVGHRYCKDKGTVKANRIQAMVRPVILALPSFPYFFFHQVACRITHFFATMRRLLEFLGLIPSRRCPLTELPTEMIEEILKHVDWQTLLRTRTLCTRLNIISRSLSVWRGQYARYMTANPNSAPLDAPMDSYPPTELEKAVLQRSAVEQGWLAKMECPVSMITIDIPNAEASRPILHIVEGGRWLLSSIQGSLTAYDLDNPNTPGKLIIPSKYAVIPTPGQATTNLSVDVLTDTSTLTFNIAIEQGSPMDDDAPPWWTHFWQVAMHGCGTSAELRAIQLTSFTTPSPFWCQAACLRGQHYARSINSMRSGSFHEIYMWGETNPLEHRKAVMRSRDSLSVIQILPNGRFLGFDGTEIEVYDIPPSKTVFVSDQYHGSVSTPIYSVLLPGNRLASNNISSIVVQSLDNYGLIACTNAGILAVTLSPIASHISTLFTLPDEPSYAHDTQLTDVRVGWRRAYIQYYDSALARAARSDASGFQIL
ncbi:hypothetical protein FIBSPDRAFT_1053224 [Athelia psychrophila]|uniref:F-box domain-containing protein n=1 Tax=Athelia psychrophila TaxID=1759441 RepID=A0A167X9Z6_9AGAM|nr:hypothetical protein FIBSPDRAFT_1053224 [Fibularhizoctonia sp. CBS 109695]